MNDEFLENWDEVENPCRWCGGFAEDRHTGKPCGYCMGSGQDIWGYDDDDEYDDDEVTC